MKYQVIKAFKDLDVTRNVGDIIEVDKNRVGKLLQYRLIGLIEQKEEKIETAVKKEPAKENTKKRR